MTAGDPRSGPRRGHDQRSAGRLATVQALYQIDIAGGDAEAAIAEFLQHRSVTTAGDAPPIAITAEPFTTLVRGTDARRGEIDSLIDGALAAGWTIDRLELLLRAILRAGVFELMASPEVPARVVIDEYMEVAHAFFGRAEPALVNGVLDHLARKLRPAEFGVADSPD
ncbi:MAG: transcription antitermination factor NusB [Alphaproteobacteria bacterium]